MLTISGLPPHLSEDDILSLLETVGKVKDLETYVRSSKITGGTPDQGVRVEYMDANDLDKAKKSFCDLDMGDGHLLRVEGGDSPEKEEEEDRNKKNSPISKRLSTGSSRSHSGSPVRNGSRDRRECYSYHDKKEQKKHHRDLSRSRGRSRSRGGIYSRNRRTQKKHRHERSVSKSRSRSRSRSRGGADGRGKRDQRRRHRGRSTSRSRSQSREGVDSRDKREKKRHHREKSVSESRSRSRSRSRGGADGRGKRDQRRHHRGRSASRSRSREGVDSRDKREKKRYPRDRSMNRSRSGSSSLSQSRRRRRRGRNENGEDETRNKNHNNNSSKKKSSSPEKKKKSRFAPPEAAPEILAAMGLSSLPPTVAAGLAAQGITSLPLVGTGGVVAAATASTTPTTQLKSQLELFVGNTPPTCTQQGLVDFINAAMRQVNRIKGEGDAATGARLSNKFAFVTFRSSEECTSCLDLTGVPFMGNYLKIQRPSSYNGSPDTASTWQVITGQVAKEEAPPPLDPATKPLRELFVGNIPPDASESVLKDYLGTAMRQVGLATGPGNPIANVRMNNRFAFLEFRSVEECTAAMNVNNIPFMGSALNLARPAKFEGPPDVHKDWFEMVASTPSLLSQAGVMGAEVGGSSLSATGSTAAAAAKNANSTCIKIGNVVDEQELEEEFDEVIEDMREECGKYGIVKSVDIPRKGEDGAGFVFVQYATPEEASAAKQGFGTRTFDGKPVSSVLIDPETYPKTTTS